MKDLALLIYQEQFDNVIRIIETTNRGVDFRTGNRDTVLHLLIRHGPRDVILKAISILLQPGKLSPNVVNSQGCTLLHVSLDLAYLQPEVVSSLIQHGANPNIRDHGGYSSFMIACRSQKLDIVRRMTPLDYRVQRNHLNKTASMLAASNSFDVFQFLMDKSQLNDRDVNGNTVLHHATQDLQMIQCLVEMGTDIYAKNNHGDTLLSIVDRFVYRPQPNIELLFDYVQNLYRGDKVLALAGGKYVRDVDTLKRIQEFLE